MRIFYAIFANVASASKASQISRHTRPHVSDERTMRTISVVIILQKRVFSATTATAHCLPVRLNVSMPLDHLESQTDSTRRECENSARRAIVSHVVANRLSSRQWRQWQCTQSYTGMCSAGYTQQHFLRASFGARRNSSSSSSSIIERQVQTHLIQIHPSISAAHCCVCEHV